MFIVRRSFRNNGSIAVVGSVVTPETIKRFKSRLKDRFIVEVSKDTYADYKEYFFNKFGVSIEPDPTWLAKETSKESVKKQAEKPAEKPAEAKVTKPAAKVVVKAK